MVSLAPTFLYCTCMVQRKEFKGSFFRVEVFSDNKILSGCSKSRQCQMQCLQMLKIIVFIFYTVYTQNSFVGCVVARFFIIAWNRNKLLKRENSCRLSDVKIILPFFQISVLIQCTFNFIFCLEMSQSFFLQIF